MTPPRCTYRLQLRPGFGFREAAALTDQLARLGVSHLYLSPCLQAVPESTHGYDVIDQSRVREDLGGEDGFEALVEATHARGMGILLDIVPNHMAIDPGNRWWWDVLENGRSSLYALYFDVSWDPPERKLKDVILMPVLADHYGRELERGAIRLERVEDRVVFRYQDRDLPVAPSSLDGLFAAVADDAASDAAAAAAKAAADLPELVTETSAERLARHQAKEDLRARIATLCGDADAAPAIDREIARINGDPDELDALLRRQHYRLAFWRTAARELDYRRFFDNNDLVALRVGEPEVFDAVHVRIVEWLRDGTIEGVRVDHVDGLRDPRGYLERLRAASGERSWILVEKILHHDERLRASWPVDGTTGYETIDLLTRVFIDPRGIAPLTDTYRAFTGETRSFADVALEAKREVMRDGLASDVERVTALLVVACESHRRQRDHTRDVLRDVVRELAAATAVYRTYTRAVTGEVEEEDRRWLDGAVGSVRRRRPDIDPELLRFIRALVLLEVRGEVESEFAMRFQQLTAPIMAKGVEDTAFYRYARLVALNEVGGDPARTDAVVAELHNAARQRLARWPRSLVAASTHDTKRSADVRARIGLLSEVHGAWAEAVARWSRHNERHHTSGMPDREMEYFYYQTLVGAHPLSLERALECMEKAARENGRGTSWTSPNDRYERALADFVRGTLADPIFTAGLAEFVAPLVTPGRITSLAQTLLRLTLPGVPDVYQGDELWDLSLVDPDDRRPVDHELRRRLIRELDGMTVDQVFRRMDEGLPKLHVIRQALAVRAERPELFESGSHEPLAADGQRADHIIAYARGGAVVVVVPRLVIGLGGDWRDTTVGLPEGRWCDRLAGASRGGGTRPVAELLGAFPVALLTRE